MATLTLGFSLCPAAQAAHRNHFTGEIPAGHTLVVAGQSGTAPGDALYAGTHHRPAGAMWYLGPYDAPGVDSTIADMTRAIASHPGLVVSLGVSFGSVSTPSPPYSPLIAAGLYDATLDRLARWMKTQRTIFYLRLGYEFDLLGGQYGPGELYKATYRHVVDRLRADGVTNAVYVWHSAGAGWRAIDALPISAFYPGDSYVDYFGISYWGAGCCNGPGNRAEQDAYDRRTAELIGDARRLGLPAIIAESTPAYVGTASGTASVAWLKRYFDLIEREDIRMASLISIDWRADPFFSLPIFNGFWPEARVERFAGTRAVYRRRVARKRYLPRTRGLPARLGLRSP